MSCECSFDNKKFMEYLKKLKKKHKGKNYNFKQSEIINFMTMHLKDNSKIKKLVLQKTISLQEMKILSTKCTGIVNLELTGNGLIRNNKFIFHVNNNNVYLDLKNNIPNADADISKKLVWHMHPWNISVDHNDNVPSFFSYEDIRISVNFPKNIFIIFNMNVKNPKLPVIYVVSADKDVKKNKAKGVIKDLYVDIYEKIVDHNDYDINLPMIKRKLKEVGVHFYYLMKYDERSLLKIVMERCK